MPKKLKRRKAQAHAPEGPVVPGSPLYRALQHIARAIVQSCQSIQDSQERYAGPNRPLATLINNEAVLPSQDRALAARARAIPGYVIRGLARAGAAGGVVADVNGAQDILIA